MSYIGRFVSGNLPPRYDTLEACGLGYFAHPPIDRLWERSVDEIVGQETAHVRVFN